MLVQGGAGGEVRRKRASGRLRIKAQQLKCNRIDSPCRQLVQAATRGGEACRAGWAAPEGIANKARARRYQAGDWVRLPGRNRASRCRIKHSTQRNGAIEAILLRLSILRRDHVREVGKLAAYLGGGRYRAGQHRALHAPQTFVVTEEEDLVFENRSADRAAELILAQLAPFNSGVVLKPVRSIQLVVPEELPQCAVDAVRTRFDGCIQDGAASASKIRTEVGSLHLELCNRVNRRQHDEVGTVQEVDRVGVVVNTIQQVVVLRRTQAVRGERS